MSNSDLDEFVAMRYWKHLEISCLTPDHLYNTEGRICQNVLSAFEINLNI